MGLPRKNKSNFLNDRCLSQSRVSKGRSNFTSLSQPVASTSTRNASSSRVVRRESPGERTTCYDERLRDSPPDRIVSEEENQLVNSLIRYLFILDRGKNIMNKARIIKSVFGGQGKNFHRVMTKARDLLSKIFGYQLVELEGSKYMLINEIRNTLPHVSPVGTKGSQQVLLFLVLTHIFMSEEFCTEESLWKFLENLGINCTEGQNHSYFGNVRHMVTEVFVAQKYIDKTVVEQNDAPKIEYKWGVRAEHEFSRRTALEFVSQIYNGRAINSWPLQYKALIAREKTNKFN